MIAIVCEGKKTEPLYFHEIKKALRFSSLNITIVPDQGSPISIVKKALEEKKSLSKGDYVWCVFDKEQLTHNPTFPDAVEKAKSENIDLAISNPSFEYWYLLHFECTDRPFLNSREVENQLKNHLPNYGKSTSLYSDIDDKTSDAIDNAGKLRNNSEDHWKSFPNSSTSVDILVSQLINTIGN